MFQFDKFLFTSKVANINVINLYIYGVSALRYAIDGSYFNISVFHQNN